MNDQEMEQNRKNEELRARLEELRIERRLAEAGNGWPSEPPPPQPQPARIPAAQAPTPCVPPPAPAPVAPKPAAPEPQAPGWGERLRGWVAAAADALKKDGAERMLGERVLNYVGMLLLLLGSAFFLKYTFDFSGAWGKLAVTVCSGAALIVAGERFRRRPDFELFSAPLIGGGWILLYYAAFASHWLPAARVVESPMLGFGLVCAAAAGMIAHGLRARSRWLTLFACASAYFVFAVTHMGAPSLLAAGVLAIAGAWLMRSLAFPELAAVSIAGFYCNYYPVLRAQLAAAGQAGAAPGTDFWVSLAAATAVHAVYVLAAPAGRGGDEPKEPSLDGALSLSAVAYAAFTYSQVQAAAPARPASLLLAVAAVLTGLCAARDGQGRSALAAVQGLLGAAVCALGVLELPGPAAQAWGFALSAGVFGTLGLWLDRRSLEGYGLAMAAAAAACALGGGRSAWAALLLAAGWSYALTALRAHLERPGAEWTGAWGCAALLLGVLGLRLWLPPVPFAAALLCWALTLEWVSERAELPDLLRHAVLLEIGAGLYAFAIDYGANAAVLGPLTPRALLTAGLAAGFARLALTARTPEGHCAGIRYGAWREAAVWLMTATAAWGVYHELDARLRLPVWALGALGLLALGRTGSPRAASLRAQAYLLALGTGAEGVLSYLLAPGALLRPLSGRDVALFSGGATALLAPAFRRPLDKEEAGAGYLFGLLSLALLGLLIAKEAQGTFITLGWTLLGMGYLVAGLFWERPAVRLPGLGLLGLCVAKAFFHDMSGLALPYRVLSFTVLGALLVLASYLYTQNGRQEAGREA